MCLLRCSLLTMAFTFSAFGQTYTISTAAGGGLPVNIQGTSASLAGAQKLVHIWGEIV